MNYFLIIVLEVFLIGLGPTLALRKIWGRRNPFVYILISLALGLLLFNIVVLTIGQFGLAVTGETMGWIKIGCGTVSLGLLIYSIIDLVRKKTGIGDIFGKLKLDLIDVIFVVFLFVYFGLLFIINSKNYFPAYDNFTFWLIDAKVIFLTNHLRVDGKVISDFIYSAYYPLHAIYIYDIAGTIVEQYATNFTILYALMGTCFSYLLFSPKSRTTRFFALLILILINLTMLQFDLRFYADAIISYLVVLFVFITSLEVNQKFYLCKIFLLVLTLLTIMLIKAPSIVYAALLLAIYVVFEFRNIKNYLFSKDLLRNPLFYAFSAFLLIVAFSRFYYSNYVLTLTENTYDLSWYLNHASGFSSGLLSKRYTVLTDVLKSIWEYHAVVATIYVITVTMFWVRSSDKLKRSPFEKQIGYILIALPVLNIIYAVASRSSSVARYVMTVFFLLPVVYGYYSIKPKIPGRLLLGLGLVIIICLQTLNVFFPYRNLMNQPNHDGKYSSFQSYIDYYSIADRVRLKVGEDSVVVAEELSEKGMIVNWTLNSRLWNYILADKVDGGIYAVSDNGFLEHLEHNGIYNIVVISADDYLGETFGIDSANVPALVIVNSYEPLMYEVDYEIQVQDN